MKQIQLRSVWRKAFHTMTKPTTIYDREMNINAYTAQIKGNLKSTHTKSETLKIQNKYGLKSTIKR